MLVPEGEQYLAVARAVDDRQRVRQGRAKPNPRRRRVSVEVTTEQAFAQTVQLPCTRHVRRAVEAGELDGSGQAQPVCHRRHDELALQRGDGERQPLTLVGQHQVIAALGVQRHLFTGQRLCELR
ncbi:hypothetical protein D3C71_1869530 [compost metagenome]